MATKKELATTWFNLTSTRAPKSWTKPQLEERIAEAQAEAAIEVDENSREVVVTLSMPKCATKDCDNKVATISDAACEECKTAHSETPHVVCKVCSRTVPVESTWKLGDDWICKNDDGTCEKDIKSQAVRATAAAQAPKKSGGKKKSKRTGPTARELVISYIDGLTSFTVEEIAELLDTNRNNAATTINLLITRPSKNIGPIPFKRTGKGVYETTLEVVAENPVEGIECPGCGEHVAELTMGGHGVAVCDECRSNEEETVTE
jgi:hypothetical protein